MIEDELRRTFREASPDSAHLPDLAGEVWNRIRRRRQRRTRGLAVVAVVGAALALVVTVQSVGDQERVQVDESGVAPSGSHLAAPLKMIAGPAGWRPVDYGNARMWVPGQWQVIPPGTCTNVWFMRVFINQQSTTCPPSQSHGVVPSPFYVVMDPLGPKPNAPMSTKLINGHLVFEGGSPFVAWVPDLEVRLIVVGGDASNILATLGPSSRAAVLTDGPGPPAPGNWQTVTYDGLSIRVPPGWSVVNAAISPAAPCGTPFAAHPAAWLGTRSGTGFCAPLSPGEPQPEDGVWLQPPTSLNGPNAAATIRLPGLLRVQVLSELDSRGLYLLTVEVSTKGATSPIEMTLGLGTDPTIARTILYSLSPAPSITANALTFAFDLATQTVGAGQQISGQVTVDNAGPPQQVQGCGELFVAVLQNNTIPQRPAWAGCLQTFTVPSGRTTYPITVDANYQACSQEPPGDVLDPPCLAGNTMPPLPPGSYQAVLYNGSGFPTPPPINVTVVTAKGQR